MKQPQKQRSKKPYIITGALFIYMCIMAYVNRETLTVHHLYARYFGTLAAEIVLLCLLFFFLRRREQLRRERQEDLKKAESEKKN